LLLAALPADYAGLMGASWSRDVEVRADGQAAYVPNGLRVIESLLLTRFREEDIAVCYPDQMGQFIGADTRVVGLHAHNPLGITFATDTYAELAGRAMEPLNAAEWRRLIEHPALRLHRKHLKIVAGGPGAWQIEHRGLVEEWGIDCIVHGEAEEVALDLFERALRGEPLPKRVECGSPRLESIPAVRRRATFGVVEITRGCGRGCQFCSAALRGGKSVPLARVIENVRAQAADGADMITLTTEDLFLYEQMKQFRTNVPALKRLLEGVAGVPGIRHIGLTHGTLTPAVAEPHAIGELSEIAVGMSPYYHPASTHPDKRYAMMFVGLETGSVRLFKQFMKGKCYPFRPEQWPDVVLKGVETMNRHNWFPMATFILGLPGETREDTKESLDLLYALKDAKWFVIPALFTPLEDTRLESKRGARIGELTDLQWEFFFTCWRYNADFFLQKRSARWKFNLGAPLYYYALGRRLFGPVMKCPLQRFGHYPERLLQGKLYLNFNGGGGGRLRVPETVEVPRERRQPEAPARN
jgi:radical SAM superfamily enzyme YgiQ (UPF0313 family)